MTQNNTFNVFAGRSQNRRSMKRFQAFNSQSAASAITMAQAQWIADAMAKGTDAPQKVTMSGNELHIEYAGGLFVETVFFAATEV